ncbi:hypothetical protein GCM10010124_25260 [Pilimelia terevasa]|uniref:VWA domain-containing protein n=1 Tax=Pilimelia terevasa TaxID=53372 RepID=A0A8J3BM47_9ACTN|nr:hypothetical protein [Pilimelia terevasa]GGK31440.1 hypothetical protein GCM10010124_25260 [Pilimelia terevasa]
MTTINRHVTTTPTPSRPAATDLIWARYSAAWTAQVADLADRADLTVVIQPGAGRGAPACFIPATNTIEVNSHLIDIDPHTVDPTAATARDAYPVAWGALVHEAGHAAHSRWCRVSTGAGVPWPVIEAATLLEEPRIECRQLKRRPGDRRWLRAMAAKLLLADIPTVDNPWTAGTLAALLLARADAKILDRREVRPARTAVRKLIGTDRLRELGKIWRKALRTKDGDADRMLDLGRQWCDVLGIDTRLIGPVLLVPDGPPGVDGAARKAAAATAAAVAATDLADAHTTTNADAHVAAAAAARNARRALEAQAQAQARDAARKVFGRRATATGPTRQPQQTEQATARQLSRALKAAARRDPVVVSTTAATPPGRLIARAAVTAAAQRAAGVRPDAQPWRSSTSRRVLDPPLAVGITVDVSVSMRAWLGPCESAAWITAQAAAWAGAHTATITFGRDVTPITYPGQPPGHVRQLGLESHTRGFCTTVDALDGALHLSDPRGGARLLVIVSDGELLLAERLRGQEQLDRLRKAGCAVLWLGPADSQPLHGVTARLGLAPAQAGNAITEAATAALRRQ